MLRRFLSWVYLIYCILVFVATFLVAIVPIFIHQLIYTEPKRIRQNHKIFKPWMDVYMLLIFCRVSRMGKELMEPDEACVIIANHTNFMDITLTSAYIPIPNKTLAKKELDKYPIFNILYRAGSILIDRSSAKSRQEAFEQMRYFLANRIGVCLFPEGTRNRTDKPLLRFKDGAFRLAIEENVPLVITALIGTRYVLNFKGSARPTHLGIHFIEKVYPSDFAAATEMSTYCHQRLEEYLTAAQSDRSG